MLQHYEIQIRDEAEAAPSKSHNHRGNPEWERLAAAMAELPEGKAIYMPAPEKKVRDALRRSIMRRASRRFGKLVWLATADEKGVWVRRRATGTSAASSTPSAAPERPPEASARPEPRPVAPRSRSQAPKVASRPLAPPRRPAAPACTCPDWWREKAVDFARSGVDIPGAHHHADCPLWRDHVHRWTTGTVPNADGKLEGRCTCGETKEFDQDGVESNPWPKARPKKETDECPKCHGAMNSALHRMCKAGELTA